MKPVECQYEADALFAAMHERWEPELKAHVATCPVCADVAVVAAAIHGEAEAAPVGALPDAGRVWWVSQMRARREAENAAGRPITAIQVLALAAAMGLLGACFGATSVWFQETVRWAGSLQLPWGTVVMVAGLGALLLAVPFAIVAAIGRD